MVTEHCSGGELFSLVEREGCLDESEAAWVSLQLVTALAYLHEKGICHRDIKPENILFSTRK